MTRDIWLGFARHVLTFVGGLMVTQGYVDTSTVETAVGALVTIGGVVWSVLDKKRR